VPAPDYCPCNDGSFEQRLDALRDLDAAPSTRTRPGQLSPQRRGYCFEALLYDLCDTEDLEPRSSYKPDGEQIDGSFVVDGRAFLLEAKWYAKADVAASGIYSFKGKVDGKLVGKIGLFLAMGRGFSADAVDALARGRDVNVLLADDDDLTAAVSEGGPSQA
jgi:hypothetical protein